MEGVEFSRRQAGAILRKTLVASGYSRDMAAVGCWSALWLEERFKPGVTNLIVYLCMINGRSFESLKPRRHAEFGFAGICPFMMADVVIGMSNTWMPRGGIACGAPAEPFLMMASIADWASAKGKSVRFHHLNYSCLMSNEGIEYETDDLSMVHWINCDHDYPVMLELTDDRPEKGMRPLSKIKLPEARLRGHEALYLGD